MLYTYKFIYNEVVYVTFHGTISEEKPSLDAQAREVYTNAIPWKTVQDSDHSELRITWNKMIAPYSLTSVPFITITDCEEANGGFNVTGVVNGKPIKIEGTNLWLDGKLEYSEGNVPEPESEAADLASVVSAVAEELSTPAIESVSVANDVDTAIKAIEASEEAEVMLEASTTRTVEITEVKPEPEPVKEPKSIEASEPMRTPTSGGTFEPGFRVGKHGDKSLHNPNNYEIGFKQGTGAPRNKRQGGMLGSTSQPFVWCPTYHPPVHPEVTTSVESKAVVEEKPISSNPVSIIELQHTPTAGKPDVEESVMEEPVVAKESVPAAEPVPGYTPGGKNMKLPEHDIGKGWKDLFHGISGIGSARREVEPDTVETYETPVPVEEKRLPDDVPAFLLEVPKEMLGAINEYTLDTVDTVELATRGAGYCQSEGWCVIGDWCCVDVVRKVHRYFFNAVKGISEEVSIAVCKAALKYLEES